MGSSITTGWSYLTDIPNILLGRIHEASHGPIGLWSSYSWSSWYDQVTLYYRLWILSASAHTTMHALTIAVRYAAVRTHNFSEQLLDYQTHQVCKNLLYFPNQLGYIHAYFSIASFHWLQKPMQSILQDKFFRPSISSWCKSSTISIYPIWLSFTVLVVDWRLLVHGIERPRILFMLKGFA
jgi:hypothetical protein